MCNQLRKGVPMSYNDAELIEFSDRYRGFIRHDATQASPRLRLQQAERGYNICDYLLEHDEKTREPHRSGYGVSPTGTGKTVQGLSFVVGVNTVPDGAGRRCVLGDETEGRRAVAFVPTNHLLDRWEDEMLGEPDEHGERHGGRFQEIRREHVGIYRATDSFDNKLRALQSPIVAITYDAARWIANELPMDFAECTPQVCDAVTDALYENPRISLDEFKEAQRLMAGNIVADEDYARLQELLAQAGLSEAESASALGRVNEHQRQELRKALLNLLNSPDKATIALLDEVDDRPRGDATRQFIQEQVMPGCFAFGLTATHFYRNGKTTGDYLFGGNDPVYEVPFQQAVNGREIAPMRNLAFVPDLDAAKKQELSDLVQRAMQKASDDGAKSHELDFSDGECEKMVRISGIEDLAIDTLLRGSEPKTGKRYLDMKSVWYCANVKHAEHMARRINEAVTQYLAEHPEQQGDAKLPFAEAVSGRMERGEQREALVRFRHGDTRALTNNVLLTRGFDDPEAELCFMLCPSRSPSRVLQAGGRVMRRNPQDSDKIAQIISYLFPAGVFGKEEQVVFGQLAGGMRLVPDEDYEFPETRGKRSAPPSEKWWVNMPGVAQVITDEQQYKMFRQNCLTPPEKKPRSMLSCTEMARKLGMKEEWVKEFLYSPLEEAYNERRLRRQYIGMPQASKDELPVRAQKFPVWLLGNYKDGDRTEFCISQDLELLSRLAVCGAKGPRPAEFMPEKNAISFAAGAQTGRARQCMEQLKTACLNRKTGQAQLEVEGIFFDATQLGFFRKEDGKTEFALSPEALAGLRSYATGETAEQAQLWLASKNLQTGDWIDLQKTAALTAARPGTGRYALLASRFDTAEKQLTPASASQTINTAGTNLLFGRRSLPHEGKTTLCLHRSSLAALKDTLVTPVERLDVDEMGQGRQGPDNGVG